MEAPQWPPLPPPLSPISSPISSLLDVEKQIPTARMSIAMTIASMKFVSDDPSSTVLVGVFPKPLLHFLSRCNAEECSDSSAP